MSPPLPLKTMVPDGLSQRSVDRLTDGKLGDEIAMRNLEKLRRTQEHLGFSYREMAARLGVHRNTYLNWVTGRTSVPPMALMAVEAMTANILAELKRKPKAE